MGCGYDDHGLPPIRGGNQSYHTACHFAAMSALTALLTDEEQAKVNSLIYP